jgi:protein involved in polysaccharide export with SLBB domain
MGNQRPLLEIALDWISKSISSPSSVISYQTMNSFVRVLRFSLLVGCVGAVISLLMGCETMPPSGGNKTPVVSPTGGGSDNPTTIRGSSDVLRPGDILIITFSGASDPPPRHEDRVREDGFVTLPFVGPLKADGRTRADLQESIRSMYVPKYYKQLTVNVNSDSRTFTVSGEVKLPNRIMYLGRTTVLKAIAAAGDFTDFANPKKVEVIRANGKKDSVNCIKARTNPKLDLEIFPDDHIYVPRRLF